MSKRNYVYIIAMDLRRSIFYFEMNFNIIVSDI